MRNFAILGICVALFVASGTSKDSVIETKAAPSYAVEAEVGSAEILDRLASLEQQMAVPEPEVAEEYVEPTVYYKRQWQRTGRFGRGRWVNVPYSR